MAQRPDPGALLRRLLAGTARARRVRPGHRPGSPAKGPPVILPPIALGPSLTFSMQPASGATEGTAGAFTFDGLRLIGPVTAAVFDRTTGRQVAGAAVSGTVGAFTMPQAGSSYEIRLTTPGLIGAIVSAPFSPIAVVVTPPPETPPPLLNFVSPPTAGQAGSAGTFTYNSANLTGPVTATVRNVSTGAVISSGTASGGSGAFVRPPVGVTWRVELTSPGAAAQFSASFTSTAPPPAPTVPAVTQAASAAGTAQVGQQLTGTPATFSGNPTPTVSNAWLRGSTTLTTSLTYTPVEADIGAVLTFRSTATNSAGAASSSATTAAVVAAPAPGTGPDDATIGTEPATIGGEQATVGTVPAAGPNDVTWNGQPVTWNGQPVTWTPGGASTGPSANAVTYDGEEVTYDGETVEYA